MPLPFPQPPVRAPHRRRREKAGQAPWVPGLLLGLAAGLAACAGREIDALSAEVVQRDRIARAELEATIAEDHAALADLIASDRFVELEAVYADPELREIALRLVEHTQALQRLDDTNVLAPVVP